MAMCAADGLRRQWFRREPSESMLRPSVDTRMCALVGLLGVPVCVPYLPVCVRACVCVRAQSFSRANEMVERLKDQTNYVLDKCARLTQTTQTGTDRSGAAAVRRAELSSRPAVRRAAMPQQSQQ